MAVTVTTDASADDLREIERILKKEQSLTPRSIAALSSGTVAIARDETKIVGWLVSEQLRAHLYELGAAYVLPDYRRAGVLGRLIDALVEADTTYVAALFSPELAQYLCDKKGFSKTTLGRIIVLSRWKFVSKRLTNSVRVARHVSSRTPLFIIKVATR